MTEKLLETMLSESPQPALISALPPSRTQRLAAVVAGLLLLVLFFAVLPFVDVRLGEFDAFIPVAAAIMFLNNAITATLLYAQFLVLRFSALLVLATGYVFTALAVVAQALAFPGAFEPEGMFGAGPQTSLWLFVVWQTGLPATIIVFQALGRAPGRVRLLTASVRIAVLASVAGAVALVCALTWLIAAHHDILPVIVVNVTEPGGAARIVGATMLALNATAFLSLWFSGRSVLDRLLVVVALASLLSSMLTNLVEHRFDTAWYASYVFTILATSFALVMLLGESTMHYARLARSVLAQGREHEVRLMTLDAMWAAIAHETKQPLAAIVMNANAGLRWLDRASPALVEAQASFAQISADGHRASEAIQSMRALISRKEQAGFPLDPNELIRKTIALVRKDLEDAGISIELGLAEQIPPIHGQYGQLQEVILNLVTNAGEAMRAVIDRARVLSVRCERSNADGVAILVGDSGIGINPRDRDRIFSAFFTTKWGGMGMGLAVCRSIVEGHGGTLSVSAGAPYGSVFRVDLPASR